MMLYNFQHFQVPCFDVYLSYSPTSSPSTSLFHAWTPIGLTRRVPAPLVFKRDNDVRSYSDYNEMQPSMAELFLMVPKKGPIIFKSALLIWVPSWIMWNTLRIINKFSCMHWDCTHFWFQFHITINNFQPPRGGFFFVFCFFGPMGKNPKKIPGGFRSCYIWTHRISIRPRSCLKYLRQVIPGLSFLVQVTRAGKFVRQFCLLNLQMLQVSSSQASIYSALTYSKKNKPPPKRITKASKTSKKNNLDFVTKKFQVPKMEESSPI